MLDERSPRPGARPMRGRSGRRRRGRRGGRGACGGKGVGSPARALLPSCAATPTSYIHYLGERRGPESNPVVTQPAMCGPCARREDRRGPASCPCGLRDDTSARPRPERRPATPPKRRGRPMLVTSSWPPRGVSDDPTDSPLVSTESSCREARSPRSSATSRARVRTPRGTTLELRRGWSLRPRTTTSNPLL